MADECKDGIDNLSSDGNGDSSTSSSSNPALEQRLGNLNRGITNGGSFYGDDFTGDALEFFKQYLSENPNATLEEAIRAWYLENGSGTDRVDPNASIYDIKNLEGPDESETDELAGANSENKRKKSRTQQYAELALGIVAILASRRGGACEAKPQRTKKANCETEDEDWDEDTEGEPSEDNTEENPDANETEE